MFLLLIFFSIPAHAQVSADFQKPDDVLQYIRHQSPEAKRLELIREAGLDESKAVRRWLNPAFTSQTLFSKAQGVSRSQIQLGILQPIEFGSRASFKTTASEAIEQKSQAEYELGLSEALIEAGQNLIRLEQLKQERHAIDESISTYQKLVQQYRSRPRLSPEQEVALSVYQLSQGDFLVRQESVEREEKEIISRLSARYDLKPEQIKNLSGSELAMSEKVQNLTVEGPRLQVIDSDLKTAGANVSLERADIFSQIAVGPMVQLDSEGSTNAQWYGFQLSFPLPFWNQNGSGVNSAVQKLKAAEVGQAMQKRELNETLQRLSENYLRYQGLLKQIPDSKSLESNHRKIESQILRGLVSSSLVVESHRSLIEIQKSRHETELNLVTSLWKIYQIQGRSKEIHL